VEMSRGSSGRARWVPRRRFAARGAYGPRREGGGSLGRASGQLHPKNRPSRPSAGLSRWATNRHLTHSHDAGRSVTL
jgi:hypothetical protein